MKTFLVANYLAHAQWPPNHYRWGYFVGQHFENTATDDAPAVNSTFNFSTAVYNILRTG